MEYATIYWSSIFSTALSNRTFHIFMNINDTENGSSLFCALQALSLRIFGTSQAEKSRRDTESERDTVGNFHGFQCGNNKQQPLLTSSTILNTPSILSNYLPAHYRRKDEAEREQRRREKWDASCCSFALRAEGSILQSQKTSHHIPLPYHLPSYQSCFASEKLFPYGVLERRQEEKAHFPFGNDVINAALARVAEGEVGSVLTEMRQNLISLCCNK
ncbi:tRNA (guanine(37)-N1)-methyltransferase [Dirofilaria immitis]